ncbi:MAG: hypothetical protein RIG61_01805 [Deltaproteobacteria bacterium]
MAQKRKTSPQRRKTSARKEAKVKNTDDTVNGLSGFVRENYLIGLDTAHSVLEENKRLVDAQFEQLGKIQREYTTRMKSFFGKLPKEYSGFGFAEGLDRVIEFQNNYLRIIKKASDNYSKEVLDLNQKSAERAFSAFERYISHLSQ